MKQTVKSTVSVFLALILLLAMVACNTVDKTGAWENAIYRKDMELGKGSKTIVVEVEAEDQKVAFTIHTDKETVGDALMELDLIEGEEGAYGLYVKKVNGILADYDVDQHYWALYIDGEYAMSGVDSTEIEDGVTYRMVRTK